VGGRKASGAVCRAGLALPPQLKSFQTVALRNNFRHPKSSESRRFGPSPGVHLPGRGRRPRRAATKAPPEKELSQQGRRSISVAVKPGAGDATARFHQSNCQLWIDDAENFRSLASAVAVICNTWSRNYRPPTPL
jgi:hypothetical protein